MPICFITDSELDTRSLTEMGLTAKPNTTTPIGMFGTGLKYTIAVLVRLRIPFKIFIGTTEYEFYEKTEDFRGTTYHPLFMRKRKVMSKWFSVRLPYNTNYGKNWELWMVYRELHSNTLDEKGWIGEETDYGVEKQIAPGKTVIAIYGKEFEEVYRKRDEIFCPWASYDTGLDHTGQPALLEFQPKPSKHIYYRGLRVYTSSRPFLNTYNILSHLTLTEDRTANFWGIAYAIVSYFTGRCVEPKEIRNVLEAGDAYAERTLDWNFGAESSPSNAFIEATKGKQHAYAHLSGFTSQYKSYYGSDEPETINCPDEVWDTIEEVLTTNLDVATAKRIRIELCMKFGRTIASPIPLPVETPAPTGVTTDAEGYDIPF